MNFQRQQVTFQFLCAPNLQKLYKLSYALLSLSFTYIFRKESRARISDFLTRVGLEVPCMVHQSLIQTILVGALLLELLDWKDFTKLCSFLCASWSTTLLRYV